MRREWVARLRLHGPRRPRLDDHELRINLGHQPGRRPQGLQGPKVQIQGHTDSVSDDASNQTLSEQRAKAVTEALTSNGVTASIESVGYGETRPVAPNENPDGSDNPGGRRLNRRVEVFVPAF